MAQRSLRVGDTCLWFPDLGMHETPVPAIVGQTNEEGLLSLACLPIGSREVVWKRGVPHRSHPMTANPQRVRNTGIWDFIESTEPKKRKDVNA